MTAVRRAFTTTDATAYADARPLIPAWVHRQTCERYGLTMIQRAAFICLWDHADARTLLSHPSQAQIAREIGCRERAVRYALATLYERGLIAVHSAAHGVPVVYQLNRAMPPRVAFA